LFLIIQIDRVASIHVL